MLFWTNPGSNTSTTQQLNSYLPPISQTIQVRQTRRVGHYWRSKDKLISNILLWTPTCGHTSVGWPAMTYILHLCADIGGSLEDLPGAIYDRRESENSVLSIQIDDDILIKWQASEIDMAQLVGAAEYTNCISAEQYNSPQQVSLIWH